MRKKPSGFKERSLPARESEVRKLKVKLMQTGHQAAEFVQSLAKLSIEQLREQYGDDRLIAAQMVMTDKVPANWLTPEFCAKLAEEKL